MGNRHDTPDRIDPAPFSLYGFLHVVMSFSVVFLIVLTSSLYVDLHGCLFQYAYHDAFV